MSMSRRPDRTPPSHASHAPVDSRHSSSPLLLHPSPTHHFSPNSSSTTTTQQSETATSPPMDDDDDGSTGTPPAAAPPPASHKTSFSAREDCWSEDATYTLIEAWGDRYVELNRGNLRQKHWQEVADVVNARHGHHKKSRRTDIQCKNRIDTLKKKYKIEKARVSDSNGAYISPWPCFARLDSLIGSSYKPPPAVLRPSRKMPPVPPFPALPPLPSLVPVAPRSKRPAPAPVNDSFFRRNFSAMAAAAAAVEAEEDSETSRSRSRSSARSRRRDGDGDRDGAEGHRQLAEAFGRFGEIYERVEEAKQRQMIELEKQRMEFTKDLEVQKMKLYMESQVQLEKIKRARRTSEADSYM